jgi:hypothetical protein
MAAYFNRVIAVLAAFALPTATACSTTSDCSLNGDCISGSCVCDPWWSGSASCDVLAITSANKSLGYRNATYASWGGMSIQDDSGTWQLFAAQMLNHCGLSSWTTNSVVVRGVSSDGPAGPFTFADTVTTPFSHNPKIFRDPVDGSYLLFSIGTGLWSTTPSNCSAPEFHVPVEDAPWKRTATGGVYPGPDGDGCGPPPLNSGCGLSLGTAPSLEGPWTFGPINVTNQAISKLLDCAHTNPSPWIFPNGTIVMAINAGK